jgi:hypothetical protein
MKKLFQVRITPRTPDEIRSKEKKTAHAWWSRNTPECMEGKKSEATSRYRPARVPAAPVRISRGDRNMDPFSTEAAPGVNAEEGPPSGFRGEEG